MIFDAEHDPESRFRRGDYTFEYTRSMRSTSIQTPLLSICETDNSALFMNQTPVSSVSQTVLPPFGSNNRSPQKDYRRSTGRRSFSFQSVKNLPR